MGLLNSIFGRSGESSSGKHASTSTLSVETLEDRNLLSANAVLNGTTLNVFGDNANDKIIVQRNNNDQIVVTDYGVEIGRFANGGVNLIQVFGSGGDDTIFVSSNISQDANLFGQGGNLAFGGFEGGDLLIYQGSGTGTINGGDGNDRLLGGRGNDFLLGGNGDDILFGAGGTNILTGGLGDDTFFGASTRDTVTDLGLGNDNHQFDVPPPSIFDDPFLGLNPTLQLTLNESEVDILLRRASAATPSQDAIIAIVDRQGRPLGIRVEDGVSANITGNQANLIFAIDGALAKARTGAFFASNEANLTSRTVQNLSETTVSQREVESNPSITDPNSVFRGPGQVAPIGLGNHFPRGVSFTPQVDLFTIETTNRDASFAVGPDNIKGTADDVPLLERFNINPAFYNPGIPVGQRLSAPDSYGFFSGLDTNAQARGIATLPGGVPIFKLNDPNNAAAGATLVGGIGVFFPGETGFANEENSVLSTDFDPTKPDRSLEAEAIAFAASGGIPGFGFPVGNLDGIALPNTISPQPGDLQNPPRIDLVGLTLDVLGPQGLNGPRILTELLQSLGQGVENGALQPLIDPGPNGRVDQQLAVNDDGGTVFLLPGTPVPEGWIVLPHDDTTTPGGLTADDVRQITAQSVIQATQTRAAIRLPFNTFAKFIVSVVSPNGEFLGLFRMPDATVFSIQVASAKARNVAYFANPAALQPEDIVDANRDGVSDIPIGTAATNRSFRYLSLPRFPEGIDGAVPGPFSQLNDDAGIDRATSYFVDPTKNLISRGGVESTGFLPPGTKFEDVRGTALQDPNIPRAPASQFQSVFGFDSFNPGTNFRDRRDNGARDPNVDGVNFFQNPLLNRSGLVLFPGSVPLYKDGNLVGGFGISGDGVDQDDVVTFAGKISFETTEGTNVQRIDEFSLVGSIRVPFQKFNRQPNIFPIGDPRNLNPGFANFPVDPNDPVQGFNLLRIVQQAN